MSQAVKQECVKIRVIGADNSEVHFKLKSTLGLAKLKQTYAARLNIPVETLRFVYEGRHIKDDDTAKALEMENDTCIDVMQVQSGGGRGGSYQ
jgi:small ubiquitin-related modifier